MSMEEWTGYEIGPEELEQAAYWIIKLDQLDLPETSSFAADSICDEFAVCDDNAHYKGAASAVRTDFDQWLKAKPEHQQAYAEVSLIWAKSACINEVKEKFLRSNVLKFSTTPNISLPLQLDNITLFKQTSNLPTPSANCNLSQKSSLLHVISLVLIVIGFATPILQSII